jgi:hypothetical protein
MAVMEQLPDEYPRRNGGIQLLVFNGNQFHIFGSSQNTQCLKTKPMIETLQFVTLPS